VLKVRIDMTTKATEVRDIILNLLARGDLVVGDRLPAESALVEKYGVSRTTVREGLSSLVHEGVLQRKRGAGTYVQLSQKRTSRNCIAALVPSLNGIHGVYDDILESIEKSCYNDKFSLIVGSVYNDPEKATQYLNRYSRDHVAGVLFAPVIIPDYVATNLRLMAQIERFGIPFVIIDSPMDSTNQGRFTFVGSNNYGGSKKLMKHIISSGRQRIAYIRFYPGVASSDQRYQAYIYQLEENSIAIDESLIKILRFGESIQELGIMETRELLQANPRPDAILCTNDFVAKNCILELQKQGFRVPDDIAVAGFDDLDFSEYLTPSLTTVRQPVRQIGKLATEILMAKINKSIDYERQLFLECEIVIRESA